MFHMATFGLNSQGDRFNHLSSRFSLDLLSKEPAALIGLACLGENWEQEQAPEVSRQK